jgi:hypothetical protein
MILPDAPSRRGRIPQLRCTVCSVGDTSRVDLWNNILIRASALVVLLIVAILLRRIWRWRGWPNLWRLTGNRARIEVARLASRLTARVVGPIHSVLPGVVTGLPQHRNLADLCVSRWASSFLRFIPSRLIVVIVLAVGVWHEADVREAWNRTGPAPRNLDPLRALIAGCVDVTKWVIYTLWEVPSRLPGTGMRLWEHPAEAVGLLRIPIVALLLYWGAAAALPVLLVLVGLRPLLPLRDRRRIAAEAEFRNWPVVLLMLSAVHCGRTYAQLQAQGTLDLPRVSVRRAERVVRRAWRKRHDRVRWHQRRELKVHAARVVSALRQAEARQGQDPDEALRTMATLLATIAHRYAEGRTGQLLDEQQMAGAEPVPDRSWLHLLAAGVGIVAVLVGLAHAGLPEVATGPVVALIITAVLTLIYRGRLPGLGDLIDIVRGADRR